MATAKEILDAASFRLLDGGNDEWPRERLAEALSFTLREIAGLRPYAVAVVDTMKLDVGNEQAVPSGVIRWLGAVRNMGSDGATPGRVIRNVAHDMAEAFAPMMAGQRPDAEVHDAMWTSAAPRRFLVWPPVTADTDVHIQYQAAKEPPTAATIIADETADLPITDDYVPAALDGVMAHALSKLVGNHGNRSPQQADAYSQQFYAALQADRAAKTTFEPNSSGGRRR